MVNKVAQTRLYTFTADKQCCFRRTETRGVYDWLKHQQPFARVKDCAIYLFNLIFCHFCCITFQYNNYQIKNSENKALPYVFSDIMGLENDDMEGSHPDDIISMLKGHVREGYRVWWKHTHWNNYDDTHCLTNSACMQFQWMISIAFHTRVHTHTYGRIHTYTLTHTHTQQCRVPNTH